MGAETNIAEQQDAAAATRRSLVAPRGLTPGSDLRPALVVAAILAIVVAFGMPGDFAPVTRLICVWDTFIFVMLIKMWRIIFRSTSQTCQLRATADDPGSGIILFISIVGGIAGLASAVFLIHEPDLATRHLSIWLEPLVVTIAVAGGWLLLQTAYALHYAKLYYAGDGSDGGLQFAGPAPDDVDFAYFAFTIGMSFAVSDVVVTAKAMRRVILRQALISFVYNLAIFALVINLIASRI